MRDTATVPKTSGSLTRTDPQRLAWGVLLMAFAVFCIICVVSGIALHFFLFQSSVPMQSILSVARGAAGIKEPSNERFIPDSANLSLSTEVTAAPQSQATISFIDQQDNNLVASVTLKGNSSLKLQNASRPRFDWSTTGYVIDLNRISGEFDIRVSEGLGRNVNLRLTTTQGSLINLDSGGQYVVDTSNESVRVINRSGNAILIPQDLQFGRVIPPDSQGVITAGSNQVDLRLGYIDLLKNSNFQALNPNVTSGAELDGWVCANDPDNNPPGSYRSQLNDGLMTLRLERYEGATSHGRTSCLQTFQPGLDLNQSGYNYFALRATFRINYQSLNACGVDGSECPLVLRMDYIDQKGDAHIWYHGFYAENNPQLGYPLRCDSCAQEHEFINKNAWYTFDSGSLFSLFPLDQRPTSIIGVIFYASGHQYDIQVSELALLGGHVDEVSAGS